MSDNDIIDASPPSLEHGVTDASPVYAEGDVVTDPLPDISIESPPLTHNTSNVSPLSDDDTTTNIDGGTASDSDDDTTSASDDEGSSSGEPDDFDIVSIPPPPGIQFYSFIFYFCINLNS